MPLLARMVATPLVVDVRPGAVKDLPEVLADQRISTSGRVALAFGRSARDVADELLPGLGQADPFLLGDATVDSATELADRIRSGDVAADLLRPVPPIVSYLAPDLGRAGHAMIFRFLPPLTVGVLFFDLYAPSRWFTVPLFALSIVLAVVASLALRFLVNATAYWLHDARGPIILWTLSSGVLAGLYFPLRLLPDWLAVTLWVATPFPGLMQTPLDVLVERDPPALQAGLVALQAVQGVLLLAACRTVQRRAERKLVVQGG